MSAKSRKTRENPTLTISLSKELRDRIENAARRDRRSVSNFVAVELEKLLAREFPDTPHPLDVRLNEPEPELKTHRR